MKRWERGSTGGRTGGCTEVQEEASRYKKVQEGAGRVMLNRWLTAGIGMGSGWDRYGIGLGSEWDRAGIGRQPFDMRLGEGPTVETQTARRENAKALGCTSCSTAIRTSKGWVG